MKKNESTLTRNEFQVMSILWDIGHSACTWDIIERWPEPKPAYTTVATCLKVLYEKEFIDYFKHQGEGKAHLFVAKVTRAEYTRQAIQDVKQSLFDDSIKKMFNFFVREEHLTAEEIQELWNQLQEEEVKP
ncbi:MAG: BlaI/MecI/CopY family transcriptional regulator [Prevotella sp.]|nr:BlaI/MecI/CopY family transcriptional regulator [Bacteroidaceae bacterium]MBR6826615.1 BlaI/MecI/CopY family transcriptional regulator [Prevotella sp.]